MRPATFAGSLLLLVAAGLTPPVAAELPPGRGALLPVQDRVGAARFAGLTETLLRRELEPLRDLAASDAARAVLRSLRIRDAGSESPERLAALADRLGAEWFFLATLHEARSGRRSARDGGGTPTDSDFDDAGELPLVVLSALVLRPDSEELWWAGFHAASGLEGRGAFGRGGIETLDELVATAVRALVAAADGPEASQERTRLRRRKGGFLRASHEPSPPGRVAVIPMDSAAVTTPGASAAVATAALLAALEDFGFKALLPGLVRTIRQQSGQGQHGAASRSEWEALAREGGAKWVATGTVETYRGGRGGIPDPEVALAVRFLDAADGRIAWLDGLERTGSDTAVVFDRGRIYTAGGLAYEMMRALFGAMRTGSGNAGTAGGS